MARCAQFGLYVVAAVRLDHLLLPLAVCSDNPFQPAPVYPSVSPGEMATWPVSKIEIFGGGRKRLRRPKIVIESPSDAALGRLFKRFCKYSREATDDD